MLMSSVSGLLFYEIVKICVIVTCRNPHVILLYYQNSEKSISQCILIMNDVVKTAINSYPPYLHTVHAFCSLLVVSANFHRSVALTMILLRLFIHRVSRSLNVYLSTH